MYHKDGMTMDNDNLLPDTLIYLYRKQNSPSGNRHVSKGELMEHICGLSEDNFNSVIVGRGVNRNYIIMMYLDGEEYYSCSRPGEYLAKKFLGEIDE